MDIVEERAWGSDVRPPAVLLVDARSTPPRCAAFLAIDGQLFYSEGAPADKVMRRFTQRRDGQITSLEILAIAVGLSTFSRWQFAYEPADVSLWGCSVRELAGRKVVVYSDNSGAEVGQV